MKKKTFASLDFDFKIFHSSSSHFSFSYNFYRRIQMGETRRDFHQFISFYRLYKNTSILINSIHLTGSWFALLVFHAFASLLLFTIILNLDFKSTLILIIFRFLLCAVCLIDFH